MRETTVILDWLTYVRGDTYKYLPILTIITIIFAPNVYLNSLRYFFYDSKTGTVSSRMPIPRL